MDSEIKVKYIFLTRQHDHTQKVGLMQGWTSAASAAVGALAATGAAAVVDMHACASACMYVCVSQIIFPREEKESKTQEV